MCCETGLRGGARKVGIELRDGVQEEKPRSTRAQSVGERLELAHELGMGSPVATAVICLHAEGDDELWVQGVYRGISACWYSLQTTAEEPS